jgi:hypothetical protein
MEKKERRKHPRSDSLSLLSYVCINETNEKVRQGMGRTLNVNEEGMLLETHVPIDPEHIVLLSIGLKSDLVDIKGKVIHKTTGEHDRFRSGIQFMEVDESTLRVLRKFITAFREQYEGSETER